MAEGFSTIATPRRIIAAAAAALSLALGGVALAQPMHHGAGMGAEPEMLGRLISHAKAQLNLNTSQQTQFDAAAAATKTAMQTARNNMQRVKDALNAELAKAEPDLAAVAAVSDDVRAQNQTLHNQIRAQWLALYGTFSPDQKAVVKQMIENRISRMEQFREKMRERMLQNQGNG